MTVADRLRTLTKKARRRQSPLVRSDEFEERSGTGASEQACPSSSVGRVIVTVEGLPGLRLQVPDHVP